MYDITNVGDFKIFKASKTAQELYGPLIREVRTSNEQFLETFDRPVSEKTISGTFVYAHPPNYLGSPTLTWTESRWRELMRDVKALGMDTVIFQAAVWNELQECYYPSKAFGAYKSWNVIEPFLSAAASERIKVYLGGYGSTVGWSANVDRETAALEERACVDCLTELLKYREVIEGFYFSSETAYTGSLNRSKIASLNRIYRHLFEHIKAADDTLEIMMSPATKFFPGKGDEMLKHWLATLDQVPIDILAPQDSIGTCGSRLSQAENMYERWQEICRQLDVRLWANVEIFERNDLAAQNNSITATPERVTAQINLASPYVEKLVCWEAPYYLIASGDVRAERLARRVFRRSPSSEAEISAREKISSHV